jgi:hypothetical protein
VPHELECLLRILQPGSAKQNHHVARTVILHRLKVSATVVSNVTKSWPGRPTAWFLCFRTRTKDKQYMCVHKLFDYVQNVEKRGWALSSDLRKTSTAMRGTEKTLTISGGNDAFNAMVAERAPSMHFPSGRNPRLLEVKDRDVSVELQVRSRLLFKVNIILLLLVTWQVWHKGKRKKKSGGVFSPSRSTLVPLLSSSADDCSPTVEQQSPIDSRLFHQYQNKTKASSPATASTVALMQVMLQVASRWMLCSLMAYWAWLHLCRVLPLQPQANHKSAHDCAYDQNSYSPQPSYG